MYRYRHLLNFPEDVSFEKMSLSKYCSSIDFGFFETPKRQQFKIVTVIINVGKFA